jgi:hypothetical protein
MITSIRLKTALGYAIAGSSLAAYSLLAPLLLLGMGEGFRISTVEGLWMSLEMGDG